MLHNEITFNHQLQWSSFMLRFVPNSKWLCRIPNRGKKNTPHPQIHLSQKNPNFLQTPSNPTDKSLTLVPTHASSLVSNHTPKDISYMTFIPIASIHLVTLSSMKTIFPSFLITKLYPPFILLYHQFLSQVTPINLTLPSHPVSIHHLLTPLTLLYDAPRNQNKHPPTSKITTVHSLLKLIPLRVMFGILYTPSYLILAFLPHIDTLSCQYR